MGRKRDPDYFKRQLGSGISLAKNQFRTSPIMSKMGTCGFMTSAAGLIMYRGVDGIERLLNDFEL